MWGLGGGIGHKIRECIGGYLHKTVNFNLNSASCGQNRGVNEQICYDMNIYLCMFPVKYSIVLKQASRAMRNTKLAGFQATRVRKIDREGGGASGTEGYTSQTDGW